MNEKQIVGEKAVEYVKDGMVVGLGTGSTVFFTIKKLGELVKDGFTIKGIPTSVQTEKMAKEFGIPLTTLEKVDYIDVAIDGADEVNPSLDLIKGGGGALLREKIIAGAADKFIVIADSSKMVDKLGSFRVPLEVVRFGHTTTRDHIRKLGGTPEIRQIDGTLFITDNGNFIYDSAFPNIIYPDKLEQSLNMIPGVIENGLFVRMASMVITFDRNLGVVTKMRNQDLKT
ncbi:ribose-5-phosphate isomerase RpiA [Bacillus sp. FJAT-29790]|uniref:ribose-5-phosphate isomerase RpiA n=1 Tax=Bacillus sp. FJAT-29790 TaxID=1895002 RepID=UPI001C21B05F|nr:ribose-5-phosphate isomerase RpiA [Bacillus sp. FJAT-29790]MBU8877765.1 ribose-5-phosphate isomerase RpiA [Bacillus sp. FJAT-29790]